MKYAKIQYIFKYDRYRIGITEEFLVDVSNSKLVKPHKITLTFLEINIKDLKEVTPQDAKGFTFDNHPNIVVKYEELEGLNNFIVTVTTDLRIPNYDPIINSLRKFSPDSIDTFVSSLSIDFPPFSFDSTAKSVYVGTYLLTNFDENGNWANEALTALQSAIKSISTRK